MSPYLSLKFFYRFGLGVMTLALVAGAYWAGLHGGFFFDDNVNILQVPEVRIDELSLAAMGESMKSGLSGPSGRPISQLSFGLTYFFSGFDPFAFKLTNLIIHCVNGVLVFLLALQLSKERQIRPNSQNGVLFAGIVAFAWLIHPIQLTSVLYIVQRMTSLSALFLLAALLLHLWARERGGRAGMAGLMAAWCIFWPLSFFSKETGILFPLFVLAWELIVRRSTHQGIDRFARSLIAVASLVTVASVVYMLLPAGQWLWTGYGMRSFSLVERLLTEGRVLCFYIGLILLPHLHAFGLYHDDFVLSTGLLTPGTTLPALAVLAGLAWAVWRMRNTRPLISFGIAWFLVGHLLESTILPLEVAHEHRNYLPLFGILLAGADVLMRSLEVKGVQKTISISLAAAVLTYLPFMTALRAHQFGDSVRLTQIEAEHHPASSRAQYEAGRTLGALLDPSLPNLPIYSFVQKYYEQATILNPNFKLGLLGLIHMACNAGRPVKPALVEELARRLSGTPFAPGDRNMLYGLKEMSIAGSICLTRPEVDGLFAAALANPGVSPGVQAMLHSWHADYLWLREHDIAAARGALGQSLTLNPSNLSNRLKWAQLILISGEREQARQLLLELREQNYSADERKTLNELLAAFNIVGH